MKLHEILSSGSRMTADRQTDRRDECNNCFSQFFQQAQERFCCKHALFYPVCKINAVTLTFKSLLVTCTNQFNTEQLYALPTLYLCVLYLSENKQRLLPLTA